MINRRSTLKSMALGAVSTLALAAVGFSSAQAENKELKIGFVGVTSGPAAAWGTSNVRSMQTRAAWLNETGGVKIGNDTYNINIVTFDDQKDPKRAIAGMEKMAQEGVHYVVGPNVDDGAAAVRPVAEANGIIYFPYAFPKALYQKPASNAVLGMIANYQSGPAIYKYLKENKGVKKIAFVAANESDPLSQRDSGVEVVIALKEGSRSIAKAEEAGFPVKMVIPSDWEGYELEASGILSSTQNPDDAKRFLDWTLSPTAAALYKKYKEIVTIPGVEPSEQLRKAGLPQDVSKLLFPINFEKSAADRAETLKTWQQVTAR